MEGNQSCFFCHEKNGLEICKHCESVAYCSEKHRLIHRPETICFPFAVGHAPHVGRYMIATRDIKASGTLSINDLDFLKLFFIAYKQKLILGHFCFYNLVATLHALQAAVVHKRVKRLACILISSFSELILYDQALALGPRISDDLICLQCIKKLPSDHEYTCSTCHWPMCNEKCQNGKTHQRECAILASCQRLKNEEGLKTGGVADEYRCITPLRLLLSAQHDPQAYALTETLMDHNSERRKYSDMWTIQRTHVNDYLKTSQLLSFQDEDFDRAVGLLWTNSFSCKDSLGVALFPVFSIVSHSCLPNASPVALQSRRLVLEAKMDIAKGEEITISYISILQVLLLFLSGNSVSQLIFVNKLQGRVKRRKKLREKWFFNCTCKRCLDPTEFGSHVSTLKCPSCTSDGLVIPKSGECEDQTCTKCGLFMAAKDIDRMENE